MHRIHHLADSLFEDTMRRRVRDHTSREDLFVLLRLLFPIREVGITGFVALDHARRIIAQGISLFLLTPK